MLKKLSKIINETGMVMTKTDYLIIGLILLCYTILSFINLGSFTNPQTFYQTKKNETLTISFTKKDYISSVKFYNGLRSGNYFFYASNDNINYVYLDTYAGKGSFAWNSEKIRTTAKYIRIVIKGTPGYLGSLSFYNNSNKMLTIKNISTSELNTKNIKYLTDEKNYIPKDISYLNSTYFDEIYFARSAYEYIHHIPVYEWTHPPLGKLIVAIPIALSHTMAPFYYRLMGNIAGIIMLYVMYLLAKLLFKKRSIAILASLMMMFDTFHFAQTRMGTIDSILVLFIMLSFYFMYRYFNDHKLTNLFLSGLFVGCAISTKWTGLFAGLGLCIIFLTYIIKHKILTKKLFFKCLLFFILVPLSIYISSYVFFPRVGDVYTDNIPNIIKMNKEMYTYHSELKATHPFSSKAYTWPLSIKPVWLYDNRVDLMTRGTITNVGNIVIWWFSILTFFFTFYYLIKKKDWLAFIIVVPILTMFLPYLLITRVMFLYHYFPVLPFMMLTICYFFTILNNKVKNNHLMYLFIISFILFFIFYYPAISGLIVNDSYLEGLKFLNTWIF
jgi:dolichyl-phosphate-mannose-protein mannosyltransferase